MHDICELINRINSVVDGHKIDKNGAYSRWIWQNEEKTRRLGINEYGCADAVNILYTIGRLPCDYKIKEEYAKTLQSLQNPGTGLFTEETHHPIHTTAHCIASLELLDKKPLYKLTALHQYIDEKNLCNFLSELDWENNPWNESHKGAGIFASLVLSEEVDMKWQYCYFKWLWKNADERTGLWKKDSISCEIKRTDNSFFPHLAGTFHYLFNHEYAKMPVRYPEAMIDSCLEIYRNEEVYSKLLLGVGFASIDWVYCLTRALRQCGYRFNDCINALRSYADDYIDMLYSLDSKSHDAFNDLHALFGSVCALAELQQALPGLIYSQKPLRLVLDRRPFI